MFAWLSRLLKPTTAAPYTTPVEPGQLVTPYVPSVVAIPDAITDGRESPAPVAVQFPVQASGPIRMTADVLRRMGVRADRATLFEPVVNRAMEEFQITSRLNQCCFMANILQETGYLSVFKENLNYSTEALLGQWPRHFTPEQAEAYGRNARHPANQAMIAEHAYGGRGGNRPVGSGDGAAFIGRGGIQITFRSGYEAVADRFGLKLEDVAAWLEAPEGAMRGSAHWWAVRAKLNPWGDQGNIDHCRRVANGGTLGLKETREKFARLTSLVRA